MEPMDITKPAELGRVGAASCRLACLEPLHQEIDKNANLCRQVAAVRIDGKDAAALQDALIQHRKQPAAHYFGRSDEIRQHGETQTGDGGRSRGDRTVHLYRSGNCDTDRLVVVSPERPVGKPATVRVYDAWRAGKVARVRWHAYLLDQLRRATYAYGERRQTAGDEGGTLQARNPDSEVESLFDKVDEAVVEMDLKHDVGMLFCEVDQRFANGGVGEGAGSRQLYPPPHIARGFAYAVGQAVDLAHDLGCAAIIGVAGLRERELPCRAIEQQRAEF